MQPGASIPTGTLKQVSRLTDKVGELERRIQTLEKQMAEQRSAFSIERPSTQSRTEHSNFHANPPMVIPITESPEAAQAALEKLTDPAPVFAPTFRGRRGPRKQKLESGPVTEEQKPVEEKPA